MEGTGHVMILLLLLVITLFISLWVYHYKISISFFLSWTSTKQRISGIIAANSGVILYFKVVAGFTSIHLILTGYYGDFQISYLAAI